MMRFPVSFSAVTAVTAVALCAGALVHAQDSTPQTAPQQPAPGQSSSQTTASQTTTPQPQPAYIAIDPLANVRYDNRYDVSLGMAYDHMKAGPNLLQGSNLGGVDLSASYWFSKHWGLEGSGRGYVGTSGAAPNDVNIDGPFVAQYLFTAGPEWLGPHNKHGAMIAHVLVGGTYGEFEHDLRGNPPSVVGFYNNQLAPAMIVGGHFDLNRTPRWVFRITPDAVLTDYSVNYGNKQRQIDVNFAISVGVEYRFKKKR